MKSIINPILPGFNPDPSILRVGDDYYIATSTFEWFPGVQIHHSTDLISWKLIERPLNRLSQLDMLGNVNSGGIWAPCLSYADGLYYLVYTDMKSWKGIHKEGYNFVVTAESINGPWSDPVFLTASGFDPSFYHEDGKTYLLHLQWDFRYKTRPEGFDAIVLQEYDRKTQSLVGPITKLMSSTELGSMEGPHLYKHNGYYYLMTAEGGTEYKHAVTMGRSKALLGPYELDPENPMLSSYQKPKLALQKAGHASLVETQTGEWYLAHLCGRPLARKGDSDKNWCILGRETGIQKCEWRDGWLRLVGGGSSPSLEVEAPNFISNAAVGSPANNNFEETFERPSLNLRFQSLRIPMEDSWCQLDAEKALLRLRGQGPLTSLHKQSLVACRIENFATQVQVALDFAPHSYHQMAGLTLFYDASTHYYCYITHDEVLGRSLKLVKLDKGKALYYDDATVALDGGLIHLRAKLDNNVLQFFLSVDGEQWQAFGPACDSTILSDDYIGLGFTGAFAGMAVQDMQACKAEAEFHSFSYCELE